jgi:hypothetical protein
MVDMKRAALVLLLLVAACSDDDDTKAAGTTTSTTATPSTTAAAATCFTFEEVDRGASVTVFGVFDCEGEALRLAGEPAAFPVGGTVTHAEGLRCKDGDLVVRSALSDDGETYQAVERTYRVQDGELVQTGEEGSTLSAAEVQPYYEIDCPAP